MVGQIRLQLYPLDFLDPAVQGTLSILQSAVKYYNGPPPISILTSAWIFFRSQVKRIVFTSSGSAVDSYEPHLSPPGAIYTENKWNERSIQLLEAEKTGKEKLSYYSFYPISKTMAEKGDIFSTPLSIYY